MEYLWHNSTNEHKITYSHKGRFCFFLFFASPVATFFHYFAQNVRVTPNLRKKGSERRRASKKQFYYSKTPCEKKVPRRRALSSKYSSPWKMTHVEDSFSVFFLFISIISFWRRHYKGGSAQIVLLLRIVFPGSVWQKLLDSFIFFFFSWQQVIMMLYYY